MPAAHPSAQPSLRALAEGIMFSLEQRDIPHAMHLSWLLMMQPNCPLQLQSHAVLVHSATSLSLGGDAEIIENNLQAMIKRLGHPRSKYQHPSAVSSVNRAESTPSSSSSSYPQWKVQALVQLRAISSALHSSQRPHMMPFTSSRGHPRESRLRDLDCLVEGFQKMDLGCIRGDVMAHGGQY